MDVGLAIRSHQTLETYKPYIGGIDRLLLIPSRSESNQLDYSQLLIATANARSMIDAMGQTIALVVADATFANIDRFVDVGADVFIVGQSLFNQDDYYTAIKKLHNKVVNQER